jgi:hypothetical protein
LGDITNGRGCHECGIKLPYRKMKRRNFDRYNEKGMLLLWTTEDAVCRTCADRIDEESGNKMSGESKRDDNDDEKNNDKRNL